MIILSFVHAELHNTNNFYQSCCDLCVRKYEKSAKSLSHLSTTHRIYNISLYNIISYLSRVAAILYSYNNNRQRTRPANAKKSNFAVEYL